MITHITVKYLFEIKNVPGFFVCENCKRTGPWSTLERFIQPKRTKKASEELARLRSSIEILPDFNAEWDKLKASSELVEKMPNDVYIDVLKKLNLQVRK